MKKTASLFILSILSASMVCGQGALRQIENGKFDKAEKELAKELEKSPADITANYGMSLLLINRQYSSYDPQKSYNFWIKAQNEYKNETDEKEIRKLDKIPINLTILTELLDTIGRCALEDAVQKNDLTGYRNFLTFFKLVPDPYKREATEKRDIVAYNIALQANTIESYQKFIDDYPDARQFNEAVQKRNSLVFAVVKETDRIENYRNFISTYPAADEVSQAWERIHELAFEEAKMKDTEESYGQFMKEYSQSRQFKTALDLYENKQFTGHTMPGHWESYRDFIENYPKNSLLYVAQDSLLILGEKNKDMKIFEYGADHFTGEKRKYAIRKLHDIFIVDGEKMTLDLFYKKYNDDFLKEVKTSDYELAELGNKLILRQDFKPDDQELYDEYIRKAAPKERAFVALQRMISPDLGKKNWESAVEKVYNYAPYFGEHKKVKGLLDELAKPVDNSIRIYSAGSGVNSSLGNESIPVISADDKTLYFCGRNRSDNLGGEDIYVSKKTGNSWGTAKILSDLSSKDTHDAPLSISSDGTTLLIFVNGKINYSNRTAEGWSTPVEFPAQINSGIWQCDAMISSNGKALIFASIREGGYNQFQENPDDYHGDNQYPSDIYVALLGDDNEWEVPVNLGNVINTSYCDRTPFLHPDMKTLYFSSDGHGGMGKLDVFKSVRLADSCWNCWSEPVNLGKEINTSNSDWGYKISTDGTKAYFSINNITTGGIDIYWLTLPNHLRPELVATITGKIFDSNKKPVAAEIRWEDLESGKNVGQSKSDPTDGTYFIVLPMGKMYGYFVDEEDYFPVSNNLDLRIGNKPVQVSENIELVSYKEMEEEETAVTINNLFFNFAESTLLPTSIPELKRVAGIIRPKHIKVEISGHADNIGDDQQNIILSERRAQAVKNFLIKEGCSPSDLTAVGYGESRPIASNETESGRAKNRRVELKFIN